VKKVAAARLHHPAHLRYSAPRREWLLDYLLEGAARYGDVPGCSPFAAMDATSVPR